MISFVPMSYREIKPGGPLGKYVKCYYIYESSSDTAFGDTVFPSGTTEIIFNLGEGQWQAINGQSFVTTPPIEFWGQIVKPLPVRSIGRNTMLGIRFFPHAAGHFINDKADLFNNQVVDYSELSGHDAKTLHARLLDTPVWNTRIELVEAYLLQQLAQAERRFHKMAMVSDVMHEIVQQDFFDNIDNVASRYGITSRYLQKLFLQYTGLTPKLYSKINRFQNSLKLVTGKDASLTSIAYECGYFDQSHFIREFKTFTGVTPGVVARSERGDPSTGSGH
jgi:AraC-like DNA-binding protein